VFIVAVNQQQWIVTTQIAYDSSFISVVSQQKSTVSNVSAVDITVTQILRNGQPSNVDDSKTFEVMTSN
jgi:hypothetical protein